jgi:uncharacterized RDD family membrane protein YckC
MEDQNKPLEETPTPEGTTPQEPTQTPQMETPAVNTAEQTTPPTPEVKPEINNEEAPKQDLEKPAVAATEPVDSLPAPHYAGGWIRLLAYIIDAIAIGIVAQVLQAIFGENTGNNLSAIVFIAYLVVMMAVKQQTLGMMALKLKLVHADGKQTNWWGVALMREILGRVVCGITLGIGYLITFWTTKKQGIHDMISHTYIIREK